MRGLDLSVLRKPFEISVLMTRGQSREALREATEYAKEPVFRNLRASKDSLDRFVNDESAFMSPLGR